jgi:hypothetical protein
MLLQWFCRLDRIGTVRIPGKSALQRYSQWLPEDRRRRAKAGVDGGAESGCCCKTRRARR